MGIPRLTTKLSHYIQHFGPDAFKDADFIIDGCNFVHAREEEFSDRGFLEVFEQNLAHLESLEPRSIVFYFDAAIPLAKIPTRVNRQKQLIRNTSWQHGYCFNELALEVLQSRGLKVILTGAEAEDYIFYDIENSPPHKTFVFSSDSDCFTFRLSHAAGVYLVHLSQSELWPRQFTVYNLDAVRRSAHVERYLHAPEEPPALKVVDPKYAFRRGQEFCNTWKVFNQAIMFLPILPQSKWQDPHSFSVKWRQAAYAHYLQQDVQVQEYRQTGLATIAHNVQASHALLAELKPLLERDIVDLVVANVPAPDPSPRIGLGEYLQTLKNKPLFNVQTQETPNAQLHDTLVLVAAEILAIKMLAMALEVPFEDHQLLWKLNPDDWERS